MLDPVKFILPGPIHLLALLMALTAFACFSRRAAVSRWVRGLLIALTLWGWIFSTPALANLVRAVLEGDPAEANTITLKRDESALIVVLPSGRVLSASGKPTQRLDDIGSERLRCAIRLWRSTGGTLLLNGGSESDPEQTLAGLMRRIALESGIPAVAVRIMPGSTTTYEDLSRAREVIASHDGATWLVTSAIHMPRARAVARKLGLRLIPYPCDFRQNTEPTWLDWVPDTRGPEQWSDVLHEVIGRQYYRLRGWAE